MEKYVVKSVQNQGNFLLLSLKPSSPRDALQFWPGQYATIGFMADGKPSPMRCFSMVSSPRNEEEVQFAMRIEGNFTQAVARLQAGDEVRLQGPFGEFVIDPDYDRRVILLAGGIGITPFISMLRYETETRSTIPITLVYACRSQTDMPFYKEIVSLQQQNPLIKVIFLINDGQITPQPGVNFASGRLTEERLRQLTGDNFDAYSYFICGPDGFRSGLEKILYQKGVSENRINTESFNQVSKARGLFGFSIPRATYLTSGLATLAMIGVITTLDLARNVPHTAAATPSQTSTTTQSTNTSTDDNSSPTSSTSDSSSSTDTSQTPSNQSTPSDQSTSSTTTPQYTQTTPTYTNTYQAPVTSQS